MFFYLLLLVSLFLPLQSAYSESSFLRPLRSNDLAIQESAVLDGYTLIGRNEPPYGFFLFDNKGTTVKFWANLKGKALSPVSLPKSPQPYGQITPEGELVYGESEFSRNIPSFIRYRNIVFLDWEGKLIRSIDVSKLNVHHDFELIGDKTIATLRYIPLSGVKLKPNQIAAKKDKTLYGEEIVEIDYEGKVKWRWKFHQHLKENMSEPFIDNNQFFHANSIRFLKENPLSGSSAYLVSSRNNSLVFLLERETEKVIWRSPKGVFYKQHDANLTKDGKIVLFSNYSFRGDRPIEKSQIIEIDPKTNTHRVIFPEKEKKHLHHNYQYFSSIISGVQPLENGNFLLTNGVHGQITEINTEGEIVWEGFVLRTKNLDNTPSVFLPIFKARKYPKDYFSKLPR